MDPDPRSTTGAEILKFITTRESIMKYAMEIRTVPKLRQIPLLLFAAKKLIMDRYYKMGVYSGNRSIKYVPGCCETVKLTRSV